jgi:hypothetical protein
VDRPDAGKGDAGNGPAAILRIGRAGIAQYFDAAEMVFQGQAPAAAMHSAYRAYQIYRPARLCGPHVHDSKLTSIQEQNVIDYLMIFALVLVVVGLSLPTIVHLSSLLKNDPPTPATAPAIANYGD